MLISSIPTPQKGQPLGRFGQLALIGTLSLVPLTSSADEPQGFMEEASLETTLFYIYRDRDRRSGGMGPDGEGTPGAYASNLQHSTANLAVDFSSGHAGALWGWI